MTKGSDSIVVNQNLLHLPCLAADMLKLLFVYEEKVIFIFSMLYYQIHSPGLCWDRPTRGPQQQMEEVQEIWKKAVRETVIIELKWRNPNTVKYTDTQFWLHVSQSI